MFGAASKDNLTNSPETNNHRVKSTISTRSMLGNNTYALSKITSFLKSKPKNIRQVKKPRKRASGNSKKGNKKTNDFRKYGMKDIKIAKNNKIDNSNNKTEIIIDNSLSVELCEFGKLPYPSFDGKAKPYKDTSGMIFFKFFVHNVVLFKQIFVYVQ